MAQAGPSSKKQLRIRPKAASASVGQDLASLQRRRQRAARMFDKGSTPAEVARALGVTRQSTLAGARNEAEAAALLAFVPDWTDATGGARRSVARWLRRLYPGPDWLNL